MRSFNYFILSHHCARQFQGKSPHICRDTVQLPVCPMPPLNPLTLMLEKLYGRINYERRTEYGLDEFKLHNMYRLLEILGNPHQKCTCLHIAGTKGKGSVAAMIGRVLMETGRKTGVYSSPHLEAINQRISINAVPISDVDLAARLKQVEEAAAQIDADCSTEPNHRKVTFFEVITATAFLHFAQQQVDVAVLEVGMGGRLDSTNVCQPVLSVITNISFDHTQHLGDTLAKIAAEKGGIIKTGVPVISGAREPEPQATITEIAQQRKSNLYQLGTEFDLLSQPRTSTNADSQDQFSVIHHFDKQPVCIDRLKTGMLGKHQQYNGALAVAACEMLNRAGWQISESAIRKGIALAFLPGRTEIVRQAPTVMLDIAHNSASIEALVSTLGNLESWRISSKKVLILAISKDKKYREMLEKLVDHFDIIIFTRFQNNPRCRPPEQLMDLARQLAQKASRQPYLTIAADPKQACTEALELAGSSGFVCVAGSAYLIAETRLDLRKEEYFKEEFVLENDLAVEEI